tara:strand:- start:244 stop:819 length:576 start_codon:yes stop_codon:yes gene_type:complete
MFNFRKTRTKQISMNYTNNNIQSNKQIINIESTKNIPTKPDQPDMTWGAPYWFFFHTIVEKIKEEEFNNKKGELINIIKMILSNLPCPECTAHSISNIKLIKWDKIQSKSDLKHIMFTFHNKVNSLKNYPLFPLEEAEYKYKSANTIAIINNFLNFFPYKGKQLMIGTFSHKINANSVRNWLNENINCFEK